MLLFWLKTIWNLDKILRLCIRWPYLFNSRKLKKKILKWTCLPSLSMLIEESSHHICGFFKDFAIWLILVSVFYWTADFKLIGKLFLKYGLTSRLTSQLAEESADTWSYELNLLMINLEIDRKLKLNLSWLTSQIYFLIFKKLKYLSIIFRICLISLLRAWLDISMCYRELFQAIIGMLWRVKSLK